MLPFFFIIFVRSSADLFYRKFPQLNMQMLLVFTEKILILSNGTLPIKNVLSMQFRGCNQRNAHER